MIKIYNKKIQKEIIIEDDANVIIEPHNYDIENPFFRIELPCIDFFEHAETCDDCGTFLKAFGTKNFDWYLEYNNVAYRLNLEKIGGTDFSNNQLIGKSSYYFSGTEMKLILDKDTVESLTEKLYEYEANEEYEKCVYVRDKINGIK